MARHGPASLPASPDPQMGRRHPSPAPLVVMGGKSLRRPFHLLPNTEINVNYGENHGNLEGGLWGCRGQGGGSRLGAHLFGGWRRNHSHPQAHRDALTPQEARWPVPELELEGPPLPPHGAAPSALWLWVNCSLFVEFCSVSLSSLEVMCEVPGVAVPPDRCEPSPPSVCQASDCHL